MSAYEVLLKNATDKKNLSFGKNGWALGIFWWNLVSMNTLRFMECVTKNLGHDMPRLIIYLHTVCYGICL
jgi:hypothetical protein